jgi:MYXO-CTERM domain-containing protein
LNDTKLVDSYDDLWDRSIDNPLNIDESGTLIPGQQLVWSDTRSDGTAFTALVLGNPSAGISDISKTDGFWIQPHNVLPTSNQFHLYALSGEMTFVEEGQVIGCDDVGECTIDAPGAQSLLALGLVGLGFLRRRRAAKTIT